MWGYAVDNDGMMMLSNYMYADDVTDVGVCDMCVLMLNLNGSGLH